MSVTDSDAESPISDGDYSNFHGDDDDEGDDDALISVAVRELCDKLRANDPRLFRHGSTFDPFENITGCSEAERIEVFQSLKENTSVKHIDFNLFKHYNESSAEAAAECVESSQTLQTINLPNSQYFQELPVTISLLSLLLRALSRNTSVTKLNIYTKSAGCASVAFQKLLACTQTLKKLKMNGSGDEEFDEVQMAAITSGFANNTTLHDLEFSGLREADLVPVLTALQDHPALQKIHLSASIGDSLPSISGLEILLRSQDLKFKELILERINTSTLAFRPVM
jgi:hypothetical protein